MLSDAAKALSQMLSPPLRAVLWKSIALALVLIIVVAIVLDRLLIWMVGWLTASLEPGLGSAAHLSVNAIAWLLSVVAALGILAGSVLLMPAVTALVASFFADQIADEVERESYPADPPGLALPLPRAILEGSKTALLAIVVYLCAVPFLLFAGAGAVVFFLAAAWLLGREYRTTPWSFRICAFGTMSNGHIPSSADTGKGDVSARASSGKRGTRMAAAS